MNDNLKQSEDCLVIGYDKSYFDKHICLMVARYSGSKREIINMFYDDEAEMLYSKLTEERQEQKNEV